MTKKELIGQISKYYKENDEPMPFLNILGLINKLEPTLGEVKEEWKNGKFETWKSSPNDWDIEAITKAIRSE